MIHILGSPLQLRQGYPPALKHNPENDLFRPLICYRGMAYTVIDTRIISLNFGRLNKEAR